MRLLQLRQTNAEGDQHARGQDNRKYGSLSGAEKQERLNKYLQDEEYFLKYAESCKGRFQNGKRK